MLDVGIVSAFWYMPSLISRRVDGVVQSCVRRGARVFDLRPFFGLFFEADAAAAVGCGMRRLLGGFGGVQKWKATICSFTDPSKTTAAELITARLTAALAQIDLHT